MKRETAFVRYCMAGLERMYVPADHVFAFSRRQVDGALVNARHRDQEYKFTMNALMGLHRVRETGNEVFLALEPDYYRLARRIEEQSDSAENIAVTLWAGRELGAHLSAETLSLFDAAVEKELRTGTMTAQALAWSIAACLGSGERELAQARELARFAARHYIHPRSSLVRHTLHGYRKDWSSFAASCYMAYSFLLLARHSGSEWAEDVGLRVARALVRQQGPQGQWGWFYHVPSGRVADYYPVYSVHQYAMAPFFLLEAIDLGWPEFKEPLLKGLRWALGENEMRTRMVESGERIIWRSVVRQRSVGRVARLARAVGVTFAGRSAAPSPRDGVTINRECRSYELGWGLWAFGARDDFREVLNDPTFF